MRDWKQACSVSRPKTASSNSSSFLFLGALLLSCSSLWRPRAKAAGKGLWMKKGNNSKDKEGKTHQNAAKQYHRTSFVTHPDTNWGNYFFSSLCFLNQHLVGKQRNFRGKRGEGKRPIISGQFWPTLFPAVFPSPFHSICPSSSFSGFLSSPFPSSRLQQPAPTPLGQKRLFFEEKLARNFPPPYFSNVLFKAIFNGQQKTFIILCAVTKVKICQFLLVWSNTWSIPSRPNTHLHHTPTHQFEDQNGRHSTPKRGNGVSDLSLKGPPFHIERQLSYFFAARSFFLGGGEPKCVCAPDRNPQRVERANTISPSFSRGNASFLFLGNFLKPQGRSNAERKKKT